MHVHILSRGFLVQDAGTPVHMLSPMVRHQHRVCYLPDHFPHMSPTRGLLYMDNDLSISAPYAPTSPFTCMGSIHVLRGISVTVPLAVSG